MIEDKNYNTTPLETLGEFGLIQHLTQHFTPIVPSTVKGIGDDAAVLEFGNLTTVVSTDMLVEGVHFNLAYMPLKHLGYKAVVVNLSDIFAMNAIASQITVSIAVSNRFPVEALEELYAGIQLACEKYKVDLIGGDTTSSKSGLIISITALGAAKKENLVYRDGAKPKDLLVVSGDLGGAYLGLQILERENVTFLANPQYQPDLDEYAYVVERQLRPEARRDIIETLQALEIRPTSMIDVSDGLASEILHLSEESKVGFRLYEEKIPLDTQVISVSDEFQLNPTLAGLNGGEDYELLFTMPLEDHEKLKGNPNFTIIGYATEKSEGNFMIGRGGQSLVPITAQGWNAFAKRETKGE